ncbi:MAG TPA: PAS domain S-box protein [Candidatus Hydrogenedentes bacterium]|nr:PAS domain S-box protein [Candidatus Hydrogenedentota bacterium]
MDDGRGEARVDGGLFPAIVMAQSRDGAIVEWGADAETAYGYAVSEIAGESSSILFPHGLFRQWHNTCSRVLRGESIAGYKTVHIAKGGRHLDVVLDLEPQGGGVEPPSGILVRVTSIQPRTPTPEVLSGSDMWTRAIVETAIDGIIAINEFGTIEYVNPAAQRLFGYAAHELMGQNVHILMPSPFREEHDQRLADYRSGGPARVIGSAREVDGQRKDGSIIPIELSVSEVRLGDRQIFTGILHDLSRRRKVQEEKDQLLRDLNRRNIELTCLYRVGESSRSRPTLNAIFQDVANLVRPACHYPDITHVRVSFDGEIYVDDPFHETPWLLSADIDVAGRRRGKVEIFHMEARPPRQIGPFLKEERDLIGAIAHTLGETVERREAEAQVIQASKLASIGELAAGVGHEINNPVNGIMNCADILAAQFEPGSKNRQFADLIRSEADRIARIVHSLLTFSRQERERHSPARLGDIVEAVLSLSRKKIAKSNVALSVDVPEDLPKVRCRSEHMQQVVMNLIINALHALDEKYPDRHHDKRLSLSARTIEFGGNSYLRLTVEDHGCGIAPQHMERLFDPFFTTKGRDKGTGLGLSVSDGIVKEHGGQISVESEKGRYARFHVDLPLS